MKYEYKNPLHFFNELLLHTKRKEYRGQETSDFSTKEIEEDLLENISITLENNIIDEANKAIASIDDLQFTIPDTSERRIIINQLYDRAEVLIKNANDINYTEATKNLIKIREVIRQYINSQENTIVNEKISWNGTADEFVSVFGDLIKKGKLAINGKTNMEPLSKSLYSKFKISKSTGDTVEMKESSLVTKFKDFSSKHSGKS